MTAIYAALGGIITLIILLMGVFTAGKSSGKKSSKINYLESENELRKTYEDIDNSPDVIDPLSLL